MRAQNHIPAVSPFQGFDVGRLLQFHAQAHGARNFLTWVPFQGPSKSWTYAEFAKEVAQIASGLINRGIKPHDRVMIHLENCPEFLLTWHALARIGAVAVVTNSRAAGDELAYFAGHSGVVAAVTQPRLAPMVENHCSGLRWIAVIGHDAGVEPATGQRPSSSMSFSGLYGDPSDAPAPAGDGKRPVSIQYTSGSTARPKGVVWTHDNALWGGSISARHESLRADDVHMVCLPLFHVMAAVYSVLASLWVGARIVLLPRFSASRFWDIARENECTWASLVPFCTRALATQTLPQSHSFRRWGHAILNSSIEQKYGVQLLGWWGMTELITHGIVSDPNMPGKDATIGRAAPEYQVVVLDNNERPVSPGQTGELRIRGVPGLSLFQSYLDDPVATENSFDDNGYFITGDLITLHEDGMLSFADRIKDMLKIGGENVSATEVERVIMQMPEISQAAVVGKPDPMRGQISVAFVVPATGDVSESNLRECVLDRCRQALADFKVPYDVRIVSDLPLGGGAGKIAKGALREQLAAEED